MLSTTWRLMMAALVFGSVLLFPVSNISFAETIQLQTSARNGVQIKAFSSGGKTVYEIQIGGGNDQPPHDTVLTGKASLVIGEKTYSGYYSLATAPATQLRMVKTTAATKSEPSDVYNFVAGHAVLAFKFAPTDSFKDLWLTGAITTVSATQQVPSQKGGSQNGNGQNGDGQNGQTGDGKNGGNYPPVVLTGSMTAPTGGLLASSIGGGEIQLSLNVGGNQRLYDLTPQNTHSGMTLESGTLTVRPTKKSASPGGSSAESKR